jgi:hypothetical protein
LIRVIKDSSPGCNSRGELESERNSPALEGNGIAPRSRKADVREINDASRARGERLIGGDSKSNVRISAASQFQSGSAATTEHSGV